MRLYTQFEHLVPTFEKDALATLAKMTGIEINNEFDLARAYRKFDADRVARGGEPSAFIIFDPPVDIIPMRRRSELN